MYESVMKRGGTPNLHAVQHLADCVLDYGPAHGWTCFAFERMNGLLKETNTNQRNVEETLMRTWTQRDYLLVLPHLNGRWAKMTDGVRELVLKMLGYQIASPVGELSPEKKAMRELRLNVGAQFACACSSIYVEGVRVVTIAIVTRLQTWRRGSWWASCRRRSRVPRWLSR